MTVINSNIKKDLLELAKKIGGSDLDVDHLLRKLSCLNNMPIADIPTSQNDIEAKMRNNGSSDKSIFEMNSYIRKINNPILPDPIRLIYFLNLMANFSLESHRQMDIRTSTPFSENNTNKWTGTDISSVISTRPNITSKEHGTRIHSAQNALIESQRNNANSYIGRSHNYQVSNELTEFTVIGDLLFIIIGNDGTCLSWNKALQQLSVHNGAVLPFSMYEYVLTFCQCGSAYRRIWEYIDHGTANTSIGVVYQGFCVALNDHLTTYNSMVASLQSQYNSWAVSLTQATESLYSGGTNNELTLEVLLLKMQGPMELLYFLVGILDRAGDLRGGQLASAIYWYTLHGTPDKVKIARNLLVHAVEPFYEFITQWIYDGILEECHQEFFVAISHNYNLNISWTDKYGLRTQMIPTFITESEAQKILLTGKSINFLREVCGEKTTLKEKKEIAATMGVSAESMINQVVDRSFENMINTVYIITSRHLLEVMFDRYQLMEHFKALRKYMLHGQGDFILRLIEIIGPELSRPGDELKENHMHGSLDKALKSTNAQYDPRDILDRVRITFMRIAENESGWDIFTLNYQISDIRPLHAVINRSSFQCYLRAFNILFRSRRVHFILNSFFKERNLSHRAFGKVLKVSSVLHFSHTMVMDMLHFVNQIQYYINFEVLECSWKKFMDSVSKASDLDAVMLYHEFFLKQVTSRCLLESDTRELLSNLRTIYDLVISFEAILNDMFSRFHDELRKRISYRDKIAELAKQGKWGLDDKREREEAERIFTFTRTDIVKFHNKLKAHNNQYESHLVRFLSTIVDHRDPSLRCLYANLDFNGRYRDRIRDCRRK